MNHQELSRQVAVDVARAVAPMLRQIYARIANVEQTVNAYTPRRNLTESTKRRHREVVTYLGGRCPCCGEVFVVDGAGDVLPGAQYDHFYSRERRGFAETWLICRPCHLELTHGDRAERTIEFQAYQRKAAKLGNGAQLALL